MRCASLSLFIALAAGAPQSAEPPPTTVAPAVASGPAVTASVTAEPAEAEIGEPVEWILTVEHPANVAVKLPDKDPVPDGSWVLLDKRRIAHFADETKPGRARTLVVWRVFSLDSGKRELPAIPIEYTVDGKSEKIEASAGTLSVRAALAPEEDATRPQKGFRPPPADATGVSKVPLVVLALALLGACAFFIVRRLRNRRAPLAIATPLQHLDALQRLAPEEPERARTLTYGVSRLLRESIDAFVREQRSGLTDDDWIARVERDERLPLGVRTATTRLLRGAEQVKYALQVPTPFALAETLTDVRNVLEALASAPPPPPSAQVARVEEAA